MLRQVTNWRLIQAIRHFFKTDPFKHLDDLYFHVNMLLHKHVDHLDLQLIDVQYMVCPWLSYGRGWSHIELQWLNSLNLFSADMGTRRELTWPSESVHLIMWFPTHKNLWSTVIVGFAAQIDLKIKKAHF